MLNARAAEVSGLKKTLLSVISGLLLFAFTNPEQVIYPLWIFFIVHKDIRYL